MPINFTYVPENAGEFKLTLEAAAQPGELVTTNNRLSTFVNVLKGGLSVLYLEGFPPRPEQKFLVIDSLAGSRDINVDVRNLNLAAPETRPKDLGELFKPGKYDVYILGDIDSSAFTQQELTDLAEAVGKGAGLIMLGGTHSFGPGGYADTPLAEVLPVRMNRLERQPLDDPISKDLHLPGPLRMRPTQAGRDHYSLMLADSAAGECGPLEPTAAPGWGQQAHREARGLDPRRRQQDRPLLVSSQWGSGRVMAFAGDSTWRWWMHGFETAHKRFWRQTILWLARKDESMEGNVWIKLAQRRFSPAQRVDFTVGAQTPAGEPVKGATFTAEIQRSDGSKRAVPLVQGDGQAAGSYRDAQKAGDYMIRVTARQGEKPLGTAHARFSVIEQDLELDNAAADATLVSSLAAMTKGESVLPEELPDLIRRLAKNTQELEVQSEDQSHPCHTWPFFLLLTGLLAAEWYLRKRWGLV